MAENKDKNVSENKVTDTTPHFGVKNATDLVEDLYESDVEPQKSGNETKETVEKKFGVNPDKSTAEIKKQNEAKGRAGAISSNMKDFVFRILKMQPTAFWVKNYIFSSLALAYFLMVGSNGSSFLTILLFILNWLLYPITQTIVEESAKFLHVEGGIKTGSRWAGIAGAFFGLDSTKSLTAAAGWGILIMYLIRFIFFMVKWTLSIPVGICGLIYMNSQAKKLGL